MGVDQRLTHARMSARNYYETPSNLSPEARPEPSPAKVCLTEINPSEGDHSPPNVEQVEDGDRVDRGISPDRILDVPEDLKNLDNEDDEFDVASTHSLRLYHQQSGSKEHLRRRGVPKHMR